MTSLFLMFASRLGSLHALEQSRLSPRWRDLLGSSRFPSADTLGRVAARLDPDEIRRLLRDVYSQLKCRKALPSPIHGLIVLVVDGHEICASYRRHCPKCLERQVTTSHGVRTQYFHRIVAASLVGQGFHLFLDIEPQEKGEREVAAALRLIRRIRATMSRSFDVVAADALYADSGFFRAILDMGKDVIAVLKNEERDLMQDARSVFEMIEPERFEWNGARIEVADSEGFKSWPTLGLEVRVVRSRETRRVKRQLSGQFEVEESEWYWVTTLSQRSASSAAVVEIGHSRWKIENDGFNEAVNHWSLDHVYRHDPTALLALWLLGILAYDVAHTFYRRDIKPQRREKMTLRMIIDLVKADLLGPMARAHAPP